MACSTTTKRSCIAAAAGVGLFVAVAVLSAGSNRVDSRANDTYYAALSSLFESDGRGASHVVVDLDRLDANLAAAALSVADPSTIRLVTKSLPCLPLLRYIMHRLPTRRLMVFSRPILMAMLDAFDADIDYLIGRPFPVADAAVVVDVQTAAKVRWLVDTHERLQQYQALAQSRGIMLRIAVEIDVGLHRGGVQTDAELRTMLDFIKSSPQSLHFAGFMGYDGHVAFSPWATFEGKARSMNNALAASVGLYNNFKSVLLSEYADLAGNDTVFNGAGSNTLSMYRELPDSPLNDLAAGSAFLKPIDFDIYTLDAFEPAAFIAAPVVRHMSDTSPVPFVGDGLWRVISWFLSNYKQSFWLDGGSWPARPQYPRLVSDIFYGDSGDGIVNFAPTLSLWHAGQHVQLDVGNYTIFRPLEGDILMAYDRVALVRDARVVQHWQSFRGGI